MNGVSRVVMAWVLASSLLAGCATTPVVKPADVLYKEAEVLFQDKSYEEAITQYKKVKETYESAELSTKAELRIADAYFLNKDYIEAAAGYEDFRKMHPKHLQAEYALFRQAVSYFNQIHGIDTDQTPVKNALATFDSYLILFPAGANQAEVRDKRSECRDKQLQYELYVGKFYLKTDAHKAAIGRFEEALKNFSEQKRRDEVLYYLRKAYLETKQNEKGDEIVVRLGKEFPDSTFLARIREEMGVQKK